MKTLNSIANSLKNRLVILLLIFSGSFAFAQSASIHHKDVNNALKFQNIEITVTVDSVKEINDSFKLEDIKDILKKSETNETVAFRIICNSKNPKNEMESSVSYKIEGTTNELEQFLSQVKKIKSAAINYYTNKK